MEHGHLVETYNKAQQLYNKKKYRKARKMFEKVASEIYASDTDCSADIHLCNSSQEYLDEIKEMDLVKNNEWVIRIIVLLVVVIAIWYLSRL